MCPISSQISKESRTRSIGHCMFNIYLTGLVRIDEIKRYDIYAMVGRTLLIQFKCGLVALSVIVGWTIMCVTKDPFPSDIYMANI